MGRVVRTVCAAAVLNNGAVRATVKDVAARAGVSPKTVSNVIHGVVFVRPETRERVERALAELDYVPNLGARGLRNGRYGLIALALPDLSTAVLGRAGAPLRRGGARAGLVLADRGDGRGAGPRARPAVPRAVAPGRRARAQPGLPGGLGRAGGAGAAAADGAHRRGRPGPGRPRGRGQRAGLAGRDGAPAGDGPRRIAAVGTPPVGVETAAARQRTEGYRRRSRRRGSRTTRTSRSRCGTGRRSRRSRRRVPTSRGTRCRTRSSASRTRWRSACSACCGSAGCGCPTTSRWRGSTTSPAARYAVPPLTTVAFDLRAYAVTALDLLTERIADPGRPPRQVVYPHRVVVRASTG